jgi:hypothetical protein
METVSGGHTSRCQIDLLALHPAPLSTCVALGSGLLTLGFHSLTFKLRIITEMIALNHSNSLLRYKYCSHFKMSNQIQRKLDICPRARFKGRFQAWVRTLASREDKTAKDCLEPRHCSTRGGVGR